MPNTGGVYIMTSAGLRPAATLPGVTGAKGDPGDLMASDAASGATWTGAVTVTSPTGPDTRHRTLAGNTTIGTLSAGTTGKAYTITYVIKQPATGGPFTVTWPSNIEWHNDAVGPLMPTASNSELTVSLFWNGSAWRGVIVGVFFP